MTDTRGLFSSSYWAFHRNSLLLSLALLLVSLPCVSLGSEQTVSVLQLVHLPSNLLRWAILIAATYALVAYLLEWRQEAYGFFLTEYGLLENRQGQVKEVVDAIQAQIVVSGEYQKAALKKIDEVKNAISELYFRYDDGLKKSITTASTSDETGVAITNTLRDINRTYHDGVLHLNKMGIQLPPAESIITHAQIGPSIHESLRKLARDLQAGHIWQQFKPNLEEFSRASQEFVEDQKRAIDGASGIVDPLENYGKLLSSIRKRLLREKWLTTSRVWAFGAVIPTLLYVAALSHFVGAEYFHFAPAICDAL